MELINTLPPHFIEHDFFGKMFAGFDTRVFSDIRVVVTESKTTIPVDGRNVIVIQTAGNERAEIPDYHSRVLAVFKHHMDLDRVENVYHIPLPYTRGFSGVWNKPILERRHRVFFSGRVCRNRIDACHAMRKLAAMQQYRSQPISFTKQWAAGFPVGKYSAIMSDSQIAISPAGGVRCECLRFTEAVACGCIVIAAKHPPLRVFKACPAIYLSDWRKLRETIETLSPTRLTTLHSQMVDCWVHYFSPAAVAGFISETVVQLRE